MDGLSQINYPDEFDFLQVKQGVAQCFRTLMRYLEAKDEKLNSAFIIRNLSWKCPSC